MKKQFRIIVFLGSLFFVGPRIRAQEFVHPGILHTNKDLQRMKMAVANKEEPVYAGYKLFIQNPASQFNFKMQGPLTTVGRNPTVGQVLYDNDANAAHQNAVMWAITGDRRYADKAIEIVNAWSRTLRSITGRDAVLMAGLGPFKMINAAEILRYTNSGWKEADIRQTERHFKEVIYPVLKDFAPFANGNWDAAAMKTVMAIAVFCNDRPMFESALRYYADGQGNGSLFNYVVNEEGQVQESGRDQAHTQLGLGMLAECCAIAWNQGLDLYAYGNNRLLKGFEYTAKFNLGNDDVPFVEWLDRTGKYHHTKISQKARGELRAVYEQVCNHYVIEKGLSAPYIQQASEKLRPEGPGKPGADHPGYGTLYFVTKKRNAIAGRPVPPAAIIAKGSYKEIKLSWIESIGGNSYIIKRATKPGGPYITIAKNVKQPNFIDKKVNKGTVYYYTVTASNAEYESDNSYEAAAAAGLPYPWKQHDVGNAKGSTFFDGKIFAIEARGNELGSTNDQLHFTYQPLAGNGEIIAKFVPQTSSQFSQMGLMMRDGLDDNAPFVALIIYPEKTGQIELPEWKVKLMTRTVTGSKVDTGGISISLSEPAVTWGRLTGNVWLRLQHKENSFVGAVSFDGTTWKTLSDSLIGLKRNLLTGITISSGMLNPTSAFFDDVSISRTGSLNLIHRDSDDDAYRYNPFGKALVPDMIADASIQEINGTFYCYATTDGYDQGLKTSGPPVVWKSKDFVHWHFSDFYFPSAVGQKYWAPSKAIAAFGRYYIYPTVNGFMYPAVSDSPDGPFKLAKGADSFYLPFTSATLLQAKSPKVPAGIDAEVFIDDDGQPYIFWQLRFVAKLNRDMIAVDTASVIQISTKRQGYSEGPIFFKRKGIYYYLYTLGGDEKYQYAYGMSRTSPLGPFEFPEKDIIATTNYERRIFGPGHGCVFNVPGTDNYYFAYLEYGRGSTNRQTYVNKLEFNEDGTIRPVDLTLNGVGALHVVPYEKRISVVNSKTSSVRTGLTIKSKKDSSFRRAESFFSQFAFDEANGSRWMAAAEDSTSWIIADLGKLQHVKRSEVYFVRPTAGHAYVLECSADGKEWKDCGGDRQVVAESPHTDKLDIKARYLRVRILSGVKGIWEWHIY